MIQQLEQCLEKIKFLKTIEIDQSDKILIDLYESTFISVLKHLNNGYTLLENENGWKGSFIEYMKIQILAVDTIFNQYKK